MKTNSLNTEDLILELLEDIGMSNSVSDLKTFRRWAYDVAKMIVTDEQLVRKLVVLPVVEGKAVMPEHFRILDEVYAKIGDCGNYSLQAIATQYKQETENCDITIDIKCNTCKKEKCKCGSEEYIINVDRSLSTIIPNVARSPLYTVQGTGGLFHNYGLEQYHNEFILMSPSTDYKELYKHHLSDCINLNLDSDIVYYIQNGIMEVNFTEGDVLMVYLALPTDKEGSVLIPDIPEAIEAFQEYLIYKHYRREFLRGSRNEDRAKYSEAQSNYTRKVWEAKSKLQIPAYAELAKVFRNSRINKLNSAYTNYFKYGVAKSTLSNYALHKSR